ncbi:hypothetical protein KUD11_13660 [Roseovarius sp. LXJ103]|nr:hypothetical protein [Roseovarius carneus]PWE37151.1 hypothetical protein DD563_01085 [Pelagicola sp. LXJ1103]
MRFFKVSAGALALAALTACAPAIPESGPNTGAGVGFGDYDEYQANREAALTGQSLPPPSTISSEPLSATGPQSESDAVAEATRAALGGSAEEIAANSGQPVLNASPDNPPPAVVNSVGISNENDFDAVGNQRSIEGDAQRIAANRAQFEVAAVEALPSREGQGPNIVDYALRTKHPLGTQVHRRTGVNREARFARNCAQYSSSDKAQIDFLENGGPERDRMGLDPDGDGFACAWSPMPFRNAVNG